MSLILTFVAPAVAQRVELRAAETNQLHSPADSNSPAYWYDGGLRILTSTGDPIISRGSDQFSQSSSQRVQLDRTDHTPMWIESVWQDQDGTLYGWYHHERLRVCGDSRLTEPRIGAVVSYDGGVSFRDLGIVLESGDAVDCQSQNGFFAGGHGDFSVIIDREQNYFYFLFDNYAGELSSQGVAIARMPFNERDRPMGAVRKYFEGDWSEPGLGGRVSPVFPTTVAWQRADTDSFWGPSIHWNTHLEKYVVLMNRTCCEPDWPQEGLYFTFNSDLSNPAGWKTPQKFMNRDDFDGNYYPQVLGINPGETDTIAGEVARFYVRGRSAWEIVFHKESEPPPPPPAPVDPLDPPIQPPPPPPTVNEH